MLEDILFIVVIFLANIVQTVTGFAGTVLAMPFSLRLVGENVAKPVLNLSAVVICLYVVIRYFRHINWKQLGLMMLFVGIGFSAGFGIELLPLDKKILLQVYGLAVCAISLFFCFFDLKRRKIPSWILYIVLILGGILHKLYVSGGPLVVIYATYKLSDKDSFRSSLSFMWIILNSIMFAQHVYLGFFTSEVWILFGISTAVSFLSMYLGKIIYKHVSLEAFMNVSYVLLLISGLSLLI
jgi:uncharacterized membrane protein YfcA